MILSSNHSLIVILNKVPYINPTPYIIFFHICKWCIEYKVFILSLLCTIYLGFIFYQVKSRTCSYFGVLIKGRTLKLMPFHCKVGDVCIYSFESCLGDMSKKKPKGSHFVKISMLFRGNILWGPRVYLSLVRVLSKL